MTDKFEEWLENRIEFATKQTKEDIGLPYFHSVSGRKKAFEDALLQYRGFLKEQKSILFAQSQHGISLQLEAIAEVLTIRTLVDEAGTLRVVAARLK